MSFREQLVCPRCRLNNRNRAMAAFIFRHIEELVQIGSKRSITDYIRTFLKRNGECLPTVYFCERITPFFKTMYRKLYTHVNVIGSEFLGFDKPPGKKVRGIRHENALDLSFVDGSIDIIVSNDVYEHVPDIVPTFREAYRVLKHNGVLLFTVPFTFAQEGQLRAKIIDGNIVHLCEAEYHRNPLSRDGSLVFYDFGWDMLNICKSAGFSEVNMIVYFSRRFGHLYDKPLCMFIAKK